MYFAGFNHSVWHALWIMLPVWIIGATLLYWFAARRKSFFFHFDPRNNTSQSLKDEKGDFSGHSGRYQNLATLLITLSVAVVAFLVNTLAGQKDHPNAFVQRLADVAPIVVGFFGITTSFCIAFMLLQTVWYEEYSHSPNHSSYRAWKYAACNVLGWTGLLSFVVGFVWLAANLFHGTVS